MPIVLLTRPKGQTEPFKTQLERCGATVLLQPTIEIRPPASWDDLDTVLFGKAFFDWLVFSSANGLRFFFNRLAEQKQSALNWNFERTFRRIAVVGPGTAEILLHLTGRKADLVPKIFTAEGLAEQLLREAQNGAKFLLPHGNRGRDTLRTLLQNAGGKVTEVLVYQNSDIKQAEPKILYRMEQGEIDWTTVTSSSIARSLVRMFGPALRQTRLVSISPLTSYTLHESGYPPDAEAAEATMQGVFEALIGFLEVQ